MTLTLTLYTTQELADMLKVPVRTIEDWRYHKTGPAYVRVGKQVRYTEAAITAYITANTV